MDFLTGPACLFAGTAFLVVLLYVLAADAIAGLLADWRSGRDRR